LSGSSAARKPPRRKLVADRLTIDRVLRGLTLLRSHGLHDPAKLQETIASVIADLEARGFPEPQLQRLKNYARMVKGGKSSSLG
jgi:hypothetical protein